MAPTDERVVATNRKAFHDYEIEETFEAGIELTGSEVKSIRSGRVNLRDAFAKPVDGELWLHNCHISAYDPANRYGHDPERPRRLLLHREEIKRLGSKVQERGYTLVPVRVYFKRNRVKIALALARGRKVYDRREAIAKREADREIERALRSRVNRS